MKARRRVERAVRLQETRRCLASRIRRKKPVEWKASRELYCREKTELDKAGRGKFAMRADQNTNTDEAKRAAVDK